MALSQVYSVPYQAHHQSRGARIPEAPCQTWGSSKGKQKMLRDGPMLKRSGKSFQRSDDIMMISIDI